MGIIGYEPIGKHLIDKCFIMEIKVTGNSSNPVVLVTGASGFLGRRVVEMLVEYGFSVRALVRKTSRIDALVLPGVEIVYGDVTNVDSLRQAFTGIDCVIHTAADTSGTEDGARLVTIGGTQHVLDLCAANSVRKLVYISSCSVYGVAACRFGQSIDENSALEPFPERRGIYSWAKLEAERLVVERMKQGSVTAVCLRPATIYGPGGENLTPMIGFSFKKKWVIVIDQKGFVLPLVYVDNLVTAICAAMSSDRSNGQIYNVADPRQVEKRQYMQALIQKLYSGVRCIYIPYKFFSAIVAVQEKLFGLLRMKLFLTGYRLASSQNSVVYSAAKISRDLGWQPQVTFEEAVSRILSQQQTTG